MPSSAVLSFTDPAQYERNIRAGNVKEIVTGAGAFEAHLTKIDLHRLWMQRFRQTLPLISHATVDESRVPIIFLAEIDQQPMVNSGMVAQPGDIVCYAPGAEFYLRTEGDFHLAAMSLASEDFAKYGLALVGRELTIPSAARVIRPSSFSMTRLMRLHKAASDLAANAPDLLANPQVAKAIEDELILAMITCLTDGEPVVSVREAQRAVMRRFERALEAHQGELLYVTDLCAEIGVSDRQLRRHCLEHLGMGPHQYLWLRRMNMARRTLARANAIHSTVTAIAVEHGFGELGRFSVEYRKLFGESPSETLRRAPDEPPPIAIGRHENIRLPILP